MSMVLFELDGDEMLAPAAVVSDVVLDTVRGHIGLVHDGDERPVYFVDLGDALHMWMGQSVSFTPPMARNLGTALIEWAAMREPAATPGDPS